MTPHCSDLVDSAVTRSGTPFALLAYNDDQAFNFQPITKPFQNAKAQRLWAFLARTLKYSPGLPSQRYFCRVRSRQRFVVYFAIELRIYHDHSLKLNFRSETSSTDGKSSGISLVTLPVAAHSVPRTSNVINPTHCCESLPCPSGV